MTPEALALQQTALTAANEREYGIWSHAVRRARNVLNTADTHIAVNVEDSILSQAHGIASGRDFATMTKILPFTLVDTHLWTGVFHLAASAVYARRASRVQETPLQA